MGLALKLPKFELHCGCLEHVVLDSCPFPVASSRAAFLYHVLGPQSQLTLPPSSVLSRPWAALWLPSGWCGPWGSGAREDRAEWLYLGQWRPSLVRPFPQVSRSSSCCRQAERRRWGMFRGWRRSMHCWSLLCAPCPWLLSASGLAGLPHSRAAGHATLPPPLACQVGEVSSQLSP